MEIKEMNIYERLSAITNEIPVVEKNLDVTTNCKSYKAVSERDILDAVKAMEEKYRIYSYPHERTLEMLPIPEGKSGTWIRVTVIYRFINIDNPQEFIDIKSYGDGIDSMDKAPGKAMTYADKYALMKAYKISTGDDPDQESNDSLQASTAKENKKVKQSVKLATPDDIETILKLVEPDRIPGMLKAFKKKNLNELTSEDVGKILLKAKLEAEEKAKANNKNDSEETVKKEEPAITETPAESTEKHETEANSDSQETTAPNVELATKEQLGEITRLLEPVRIPKMLKAYKKNSLEELTYMEAEKVLKKARKEVEEKKLRESAEKI